MREKRVGSYDRLWGRNKSCAVCAYVYPLGRAIRKGPSERLLGKATF